MGLQELKSSGGMLDSVQPMLLEAGCQVGVVPVAVSWVWHPGPPCGGGFVGFGWACLCLSQFAGAMGADACEFMRDPVSSPCGCSGAWGLRPRPLTSRVQRCIGSSFRAKQIISRAFFAGPSGAQSPARYNTGYTAASRASRRDKTSLFGSSPIISASILVLQAALRPRWRAAPCIFAAQPGQPSESPNR